MLLIFLTKLDLLEICDSENATEAINAEQQLAEANEDFEEDFELMTGSGKTASEENTELQETIESSSDLELLSDEEESDSDVEINKLDTKKRKLDDNIEACKSKKLKTQMNDEPDDSCSDSVSDDDISADENSEVHSDDENEEDEEESSQQGKWEDIYGRLRDKDGSVVQVSHLLAN